MQHSGRIPVGTNGPWVTGLSNWFPHFLQVDLKPFTRLRTRLRPDPVWRATAGGLLVLAAVCAILLWLDEVTGAAIVAALVLLRLFLVDRGKLAALRRWLASAGKSPLPPAGGIWDEVFARLYRDQRAVAQRQAVLSEALDGFRRAAQALPDGVVILNSDNQISWFNTRAGIHLELQAATDTGQQITNLVRAPDFLAYLAAENWNEPVQVRMRGIRPAPDRIMSLQLVAYGDGQKLLLSRDVTQIEKLETMRRDFVANVSHELKTPLTVLSGFLETIRELPLSAEQTAGYLRLMSEQARRMENLVTDLLTLSALEGNDQPVEQQLDMGALLGKLRETALSLSQGRHRIEFTIEPGLHLNGAETEIASALGNLVTNALRYTPEGGRISVTWERCAAEPGEAVLGDEIAQAGAAAHTAARFVVRDTGIGIDPVHLPRLTERFYRVDRGRSRESGGTGLGLAIVKHVLTRHGARLEIESAVGAGSCFTAIFPARRVRRTDHGGPAGSTIDAAAPPPAAAAYSTSR